MRPVQRFLELEAAGGVLLFLAALAALAWANLHPESYARVFSCSFSIGAGGASAIFTLREAISDGLMAVFFFVVGLEIKRELAVGELNTLSKAALPAVAALGGMVAPAAIFVAFTHGGPGQVGWGIPMATDIAFCVGLLTLLGDRVPRALVVFVTALAIFDDIGGILVIALFYGSGLDLSYLAMAGVLTIFVVVLGRAQVRSALIYALLGVALWYTVHHAGIHATIAGVILGLAIPARTRTPPRHVLDALSGHVSRLLDTRADGDLGHAELLAIEEDLEDLEAPVERFLHALHPFVAYLVLPLFALANSGVVLAGIEASVLVAPVTLGVAAGLVLGKSIGIYLLTALAVRLGLAPMPGNATRRQLLGVSVVAGIGFTVALFIAGLAYAQQPALLDQAKLGIVIASVVAGAIAVVILWSAGRTSE